MHCILDHSLHCTRCKRLTPMTPGFCEGPFSKEEVIKEVHYLINRIVPPTSSERVITYRGSITDFATDIAFELTHEQADELIKELLRFRFDLPSKFKPRGE